MITLLLILPIIGSLILIPIKDNNKLINNIALITSLLNLIISIIIWIEFDSSINQYQYVYTASLDFTFCQFNIGLDAISLPFVLITTFITPIALLSSHTSITNNLKHFVISILLLETLQIALFVVLDLFLFFIFFESILPAKRIGNMLWWVKLPNSGDALKFMIPNYRWKTISGWINHSCTVISHKIFENKMGNRGSKSDLLVKSVKEQRVDGSYWIKPIQLRCTLTGFERNYHIKIPSKQLKLVKFSTGLL